MSTLGFKARVDPLTCVPLSLVHNGILRFTSGATPADFLAAIGQPLLNWSFEEKTFVKQSITMLCFGGWGGGKVQHTKHGLVKHTKTCLVRFTLKHSESKAF